MDRRREPRLECNRSVTINILGQDGPAFPGQLANCSGGGARLLVDRAIPEGSALKVECDDLLLLGEVCYCQPSDGGYAVGVMLEHSLVCTEELARLARQLQGESARERVRQAQRRRR